MMYYIFIVHGEYIGGALGVVAPSIERAIQLILQYSREHSNGTREFNFYLRPENVLETLPERQKGDMNEYWIPCPKASLPVSDVEPEGVRFFEMNDG